MKTGLIIQVVLLLVYGIGFLVVPDFVGSIYGFQDVEAAIITRFLGSAFIGLAVISYFARQLPENSEGLRPIVYGNILFNVTGLIANILFQFSVLANPLAWVNVALYVLFTLFFAYYGFVRRPWVA